MSWRNWSVIIVLILANYLVFSLIGAVLFPAVPPAAPTHVTRPTFTPGAQPLQRATLPSEILSASPVITATGTLTTTTTPQATVIPTRAP